MAYAMFGIGVLALLGCAGDGHAAPALPAQPQPSVAVETRPAAIQPRVTIVATPKKEGPSPLRVRLRAELTGIDGPVSFLWRLGDGSESTAREPPDRVYGVGRYDVILTVTDAQGRRYKTSVTIESQCKGC